MHHTSFSTAIEEFKKYCLQYLNDRIAEGETIHLIDPTREGNIYDDENEDLREAFENLPIHLDGEADDFCLYAIVSAKKENGQILLDMIDRNYAENPWQLEITRFNTDTIAEVCDLVAEQKDLRPALIAEITALLATQEDPFEMVSKEQIEAQGEAFQALPDYYHVPAREMCKVVAITTIEDGADDDGALKAQFVLISDTTDGALTPIENLSTAALTFFRNMLNQ